MEATFPKNHKVVTNLKWFKRSESTEYDPRRDPESALYRTGHWTTTGRWTVILFIVGVFLFSVLMWATHPLGADTVRGFWSSVWHWLVASVYAVRQLLSYPLIAVAAIAGVMALASMTRPKLLTSEWWTAIAVFMLTVQALVVILID